MLHKYKFLNRIIVQTWEVKNFGHFWVDGFGYGYFLKVRNEILILRGRLFNKLPVVTNTKRGQMVFSELIIFLIVIKPCLSFYFTFNYKV
jgi:hypothetical protein